MNASAHPDAAASSIAAAIGEPARARMLYCLMDGHARTSTELAVVSGVTPPTASAHLNRLKAEALVSVFTQGKHRYYSLSGPHVARFLENLSVLAGRRAADFKPNTPAPLRAARTCYDHMAGTAGVLLHDRLRALRWLRTTTPGDIYTLTPLGVSSLATLGIDIESTHALRRRFACPCLDWSERKPHLGGALGAAMLTLFLKKRWLTRQLDSRALDITTAGRRELLTRFGLQL